jgi:hypothetical protein
MKRLLRQLLGYIIKNPDQLRQLRKSVEFRDASLPAEESTDGNWGIRVTECSSVEEHLDVKKRLYVCCGYSETGIISTVNIRY